jgi:hypothetical protein
MLGLARFCSNGPTTAVTISPLQKRSWGKAVKFVRYASALPAAYASGAVGGHASLCHPRDIGDPGEGGASTPGAVIERFARAFVAASPPMTSLLQSPRNS